jgi:Sds3-like
MGRSSNRRRYASVDSILESHFLNYNLHRIGTHPELIQLHAELSKRRDKRLELAARKRAYEASHVMKKRTLEEEATWSWWKVSSLSLIKELKLTMSHAGCTR